MTEPEVGHSADELAQALPESGYFSDIACAKRGQTVCDLSLKVARQQLAQSDNLSKHNRRVGL